MELYIYISRYISRCNQDGGIWNCADLGLNLKGTFDVISSDHNYTLELKRWSYLFFLLKISFFFQLRFLCNIRFAEFSSKDNAGN